MKSPFRPSVFFIKKRVTRNGAALVVVLVLLVLMLGIVLAFFSQSIFQRQISKNSADQAAAAALAEGATNVIIGDLKQEIRSGSTGANSVDTGGGRMIYYPDKAAYAVSELAGVSNAAINLVKQSSFSTEFSPTFHIAGRAADAPTDKESRNGRTVSAARWNAPFLMEATSLIDSTPATAVGFTVPDWIYVNRDGTNSTLAKLWSQNRSDQKAIVGRYAYVIYNEGGLLDANVAGYSSKVKGVVPSTASLIADQTLFRSSQSYADLTRLPGLDGKQSTVDQLVDWRNQATLTTGNAPDKFLNFATANDRSFVNVASNPAEGAGSDRQFVTRQGLINFFKTQLGGSGDQNILNLLQYFGTFSRSLSQPGFWPGTRPKSLESGAGVTNSAVTFEKEDPDILNPKIKNVRVINEFERNDGSRARTGEPLIKKRFALNRLAWLTYKGPSATLARSDSLYSAYKKYGISEDFLKEGTADNIEKYFGLAWENSGPLGGYWKYLDKYSVKSGNVKTIAFLSQVASGLAGGPREPNFFELLQGAIHSGSLGKAMGQDEISSYGRGLNDIGNWLKDSRDWRVDFQALAIGANMIDQFSPDSYPTRIIFDDKKWLRPLSFEGKVDLPYIAGLLDVPIVTKTAIPASPSDSSPKAEDLTDPGQAMILSVPVLWNPHQRNTDRPEDLDIAPHDLRVTISQASLGFPNNDPNSMRRSAGLTWEGTDYPHVKSPLSTRTLPGSPIAAMWNGGRVDTSTGEVNTNPSAGSPDNTALNFTNDPALFREPTLMWLATSSMGPKITLEGNTNWAGSSGAQEAASGNLYLGFLLAKFPLRWKQTVTMDDDSSKVIVYSVNKIQPFGGDMAMTVSVEYKDLSGRWIPYGQIPIRTNFGKVTINFDATKKITDLWPSSLMRYNGTIDPRTMRWGVGKEMVWPAFLPDGSGCRINTLRSNTAAPTVTFGQDGLLLNGQNLPAQSYQDPDGIRRRAMGAYVPGSPGASTTVGLPLAIVWNKMENAANRPMILNRPFKSVAELGYVFRDTPWKNLDFFTSESGDKALLDLFCLNEDQRPDGIVAGKLDLNTRQKPVLEALLAGAYRDENSPTANPLSITEAKQISESLTTFTSSKADGEGPLSNIADLIGRRKSGTSAGTTFMGFVDKLDAYSGGNQSNYTQRMRETAIRAFSDTGQAGTWNLMVDVIAQTGRLIGGNMSKDFVVQGEQRYWVHLAIDRETGKVIDQQIENVNE